jgi:phosphatidylinositol alpha-1,6-mannosyltransferase
MGTQLLLSYDFPPIGGGIARWMSELAKRYPPGSLVVSTGRYPGSREFDQQSPNPIDRVPIHSNRLRTLPGLLLWSRRVEKLARLLGAEFIWCGNIKPASYPAKWTRRRLGTPYGILLHGGDLLILRHQAQRSGLKRRTARALLESASVLVTNSLWTRDLCRAVLDELEIGADASRVQTVPLGADPEVFRPGLDQSETRARYGLDGRRWLLSVARLTQHKGIDTGLRVIARLRQEYPDLGYAVVGSGTELSNLENLARALGVADRVRFLTDVPDRDLPGLYNCAEVYLGLSRLMEQRVEGFGISLVEAAACGIPVIAGRIGGIPEAVREGETGLLVDAEQPDDVCGALRTLLDDRGLAARLGEGGRRAVETYYNWDRAAADIGRIGRELGRSIRSEGACQ